MQQALAAWCIHQVARSAQWRNTHQVCVVHIVMRAVRIGLLHLHALLRLVRAHAGGHQQEEKATLRSVFRVVSRVH